MTGDDFPFTDEDVDQVYDYIDSDGDLLDVSVVDRTWLAFTIIRHGKTAALTTVISEPTEARKLAAHLSGWADKMEES